MIRRVIAIREKRYLARLLCGRFLCCPAQISWRFPIGSIQETPDLSA